MGRARSSLAGFAALINELDSETVELPLEEMVEHVIHRTGLIEFHKAEKGERGQARVENLEELVSAAKTFRAEDDSLSPLQQFLDSARSMRVTARPTLMKTVSDDDAALR